MLTIDDRLELWYSGKYTPQQRYLEAVRRNKVKLPDMVLQLRGVWPSIFLHEYAWHILSPLERVRLDYFERKWLPMSREVIMPHIYTYGVAGRAPSWIGKWKVPKRDDLPFDCWCRRTLEVDSGLEESPFPKPVEDWITWFNTQFIRYQNGEPYETEMAIRVEGPRPMTDEEVPF